MEPMSEPTLALRKSLLAELNTILSCDIYDAVPQDAAYPYVTFDYQTIENTDMLAGFRKDTRYVYLGIWSRAYGSAEVLSIMAQIDALNEQALTLDTGS